jgi:protein-S-isoprenylcysteine O-methyltransferase
MDPITQLSCFGVILGIFHVSEFLLTVKYNPDKVDASSWLVTTQYVFAMSLGLLEFVLHNLVFPPILSPIHPRIGILMCLIGEGVRKCGMLTCKSGFTHRIQTVKAPSHKLTTHGIYGFVRHPGYLGWLIWCVGTQIILQNVICAVGFFIVAWRFMHERIMFEDILLRQFFGEEWIEWQSKVGTGIPGIP